MYRSGTVCSVESNEQNLSISSVPGHHYDSAIAASPAICDFESRGFILGEIPEHQISCLIHSISIYAQLSTFTYKVFVYMGRQNGGKMEKE